MNFLNHNSAMDGVVVTVAAVVCAGTVAAGAAEEDTMSSEGWGA
jgi:hypothetical protein